MKCKNLPRNVGVHQKIKWHVLWCKLLEMWMNVCVSYRYFFKKASDEFGSGVVMEEVTDDGDVLPLWEGKIIAKVERTL